MSGTTCSQAITIEPKSSHSCYVALNLFNSSQIIAEGKTMKATIARAEETGKKYSIMALPKRTHSCIFSLTS